MLAEQRRSRILELLAENGAVSVNELYRHLRVSRETIRRDITKLAGENRLRKTHGGALVIEEVEPEFADRMSVNIEGKRAIARKAAALVPDGASMIIDSGTTTFCLAEALVGRRKLIVYTNDLRIAGRLAGRNENTVFFIGGQIQGNEGMALGRDATAMLANYFADFAFVGAGAISPHPVLSDFSREAAELRGQMVVQARRAVLLADHTKFRRRAPVRVANLEKFAQIVVDRRLDKEMAAGLATLPAEILVAGGRKGVKEK